MNTARFLFCLNSDDPDTVSRGLEEFRDQTLLDHDAVVSYGYHGRGSYDSVKEAFHPEPVATTLGVLASFIRSSPQLEELFILWGLPGRDDDKPLSASHMSCLAVIIHVASSNSVFCVTVVNRILHEHSKSIISQLSSGNLKLVHSTLALILAMCRSSPQNCRDTFQKLISISISTFAILLQQGKTVTWDAATSSNSGVTTKLKTDSRLLLIIIIFTAIEAADQSSGPELFSSNTSLLKRVTNSIHKDTYFVVQLILESLAHIRKESITEQYIGSKLVDLRFQENLLGFYESDDPKIQRVAHTFLLNHSSYLVTSMSKGWRGVAAGYAKTSALQLLKNLAGHRDLRHREVQMVLMKAQPSLIAKSVSSVVLATWEPAATIQYYCALSQLTFLCGCVDVDSQFKLAMKTLVTSVTADADTEKTAIKADATLRGLTTSFLQAMIPLGFQKKDISKLLQHENALLQRSGLLYILAVMQRLLKALNAAAAVGIGRILKMEGAVAVAVHKLLPDFQLLLNIRSKYSKIVAEFYTFNGEALTKGKEGETEKEIENNKVSVNHKEQTTYLLCLLLQIIECYVKAVPSLVSQAGFELTRLIDEAVPWSVKDSPLSAMTAVTASINTISTILGPIIRALRQATNARQCKWFGSSEDCVKLISQLLVMPDWDVTMKRSPLAKLLLLSRCSKLHEVDRELSLSVRQLVRTLLKQSGMFQGHGLVDLELKTEQAAWLDALSVCDNSILIFDSILRIAHHWNNELCIEASDRIDTLTSGIGYIADQSSTKNNEDKRIVVPFSPVMSCSINLTSNNFDILASHLPKHIRIHVDPTQSDKPHDSITSTEIKDGVSSTAAFLSKYSNGFRAELHGLLMDVAMTSAIKARSAGSYGQCLLAVVDRRHASNKSESLLLNEIINMSVMLSIQSTYSHPSTSHNALADAATPIKGKVSRKSIVVKNSTTGPGSKEFFEGIMKNCDINSSIDLLMGVLMRTVEGADATVNATIKRPRNTTATSKVLSTLSLKDDLMQNRIRLQCSVIGFFVQNIDKIISSSSILISNPTQEDDPETGLFLDLLDTVGLYTASLCYNLSIVPLGTSFYNWVAGLALRLMSKSTEIGDNLQLENKATIIIESMRLLIPFARTYTAVSIEIESESKTSLDSACTSASTSGLKRKTRSPVVIESKTEVIVAIYEAVSNLTSLIVELVRQTSCAPLIADALSNSELLDGITNRDLVGKKSRQILCAAASAYFRRSNARSKKGMETQGHNNPEHVTLALWKSISDRLLTISIATTSMSIGPDDSRHTSLQEFESDKFSLGWMIQHFVDNPLLRSQFINLALKDGQGHSLLDLSTKQNVATASTPFALIPLDDVSLTVLQSASVETLASALESFADMDMQKVSNTVLGAPDDSIISNALCCATFKLGSTNDTRLPFVSSFISPLSLMELNLSKQTEDLRTNNRIYQICPLCPSMIRYAESPEFVSVVFPVCVGRGELPLIEVVKIFMEYEHIEKGRVRHNGDIGRLSLLLSIEETAASSSSGSQTVTSICRLLSHPAIVGSSYTLCLLASYLQSQLTLEAKMTYLKGSFAAIAICSSLSDVLRSVDSDDDDNDVLLLWCGAYLKFLSNLLDDFILYLTTLETLVPANSELSSHVSAFFALLQPLLMISVYTAKTEQFKLDKIIDTLQSTASEVRKKMNKWIKSCLKFGLHSSSLLNGLSNFFCTCRESFLTKVTTTRKESKVGEHSFWASIFLPKVTDFYHPSLVLQMVVSHSKFSTVLKGIKQSLPNTSLLNFLLVLFSISLPLSQNGDKNFHLDDSKNSKGSVADQFLVSALLSIYSGTMSMADRLVLRILHVLNNADKCPALYTLMPITMNSKKAVSSSKGSSVSIFGTILQQLVYPTLSQYPAWRSAIPQPSLSEGLEAEKSYRHQFSLIVRNAAKDWSSDEIDEDGDVEPHNSLMDDDEQNITGYNLPTKKSKVSNDDSDEEGDSGSESESMSENRSEGQHSDMESILSVVSNGEVSSEWNCDDTDAYVPSVDTLSSCSDKVYDPCFWLPALHYSLIQESYSVRQLANTGALSLIIAGISSRCPILRSIALSSLQRVLELVRQQTPDKDAGFRERPQLLLLLNFIRNALDSFAPSSSGATQFPSVISLFLSRAALHLLQPTHELYSKINKYLLSRPFCDFKDVPLYDLLLVDGDAQTEQASRLTTFRMVRDGLCTRWDHLNMCRKNAYNRLMLLFPVLSKDSRAGHAIFDLLDKALGMQVSARYLLERCSIVSWLQQMASPSNSLDIDTSAAAANDSVDTHDIPNEVTADDIEDENEILKGKSGRSIVVRSQSQPSVLLAASPRLLARVLCLMRRALGASYLLSAGSNSSNSGHLDQIVLAISTIIDDVIAVDEAGMTTEIPVEFFRQLVLLMWDYALTSSNGGGDKSLAWGLGRIYRLAHLIQRSARSNSTGIQAVDDMVISLLSLLSFQTSSSLQGVRDSHTMYKEVREMLSACAFKHLILHSGEKSKGNLFSIAQTSVNVPTTSDALESTNYHTVVNSLCQDKAKSKRCREVEAHWSLTLAQDTHNSWEHVLETSAIDLSLLIHESWEDLALSGFEAMSLPVSLGNKLILCMSIKAILNIAVMGARDNTLSIVRSGTEPAGALSLFPLEAIRWALTMKAAFLQPSASALNYFDGDSNVLMRRVLSSSDNLPFHAYTAYFCDFQLTFRLTLLCLAGIFDHFSNIVEKSATESEIFEAAGVTLLSLLRISNDVCAFKDSKDIFNYLDSDIKRNAAEAFDSYFFYEMVSKTQSGISPRRLVQTICSQALDVVAGLVSKIDRNSSTSALGVDGTALHSSGEKNKSLFSERLILTDFRRLVSLSRELQDAITPQNISSFNNSDSSNIGTNLSLSQYFEPLPGKERKGDVTGAKRSTVLFDRSSAVWRLGALGSRDRVLASMRAAQCTPLSGVRVHLEGDSDDESGIQDMEDDDDSGIDDFVENENSDNDDNDDFLPLSNSQTEVEMDWTSVTEEADGE